MDTAPNHLMTCQIELVLQVLQYLYPGSKMKHPKVVRTLKEVFKSQPVFVILQLVHTATLLQESFQNWRHYHEERR